MVMTLTFEVIKNSAVKFGLTTDISSILYVIFHATSNDRIPAVTLNRYLTLRLFYQQLES